jgi:hypothetical protein
MGKVPDSRCSAFAWPQGLFLAACFARGHRLAGSPHRQRCACSPVLTQSSSASSRTLPLLTQYELGSRSGARDLIRWVDQVRETRNGAQERVGSALRDRQTRSRRRPTSLVAQVTPSWRFRQAPQLQPSLPAARLCWWRATRGYPTRWRQRTCTARSARGTCRRLQTCPTSSAQAREGSGGIEHATRPAGASTTTSVAGTHRGSHHCRYNRPALMLPPHACQHSPAAWPDAQQSTFYHASAFNQRLDWDTSRVHTLDVRRRTSLLLSPLCAGFSRRSGAAHFPPLTASHLQ